MNVTSIAEMCHSVNRAYCFSIGDTTQPTWLEAPENIQQSAIDGVMFHLNNLGAGPAGSHENWLKFKVADGWVYGKEKNVDLKTHPCIVPYENLAPEQQSKDFIFHAIVHGTLRQHIHPYIEGESVSPVVNLPLA